MSSWVELRDECSVEMSEAESVAALVLRMVHSSVGKLAEGMDRPVVDMWAVGWDE